MDFSKSRIVAMDIIIFFAGLFQCSDIFILISHGLYRPTQRSLQRVIGLDLLKVVKNISKYKIVQTFKNNVHGTTAKNGLDSCRSIRSLGYSRGLDCVVRL